MNGDAGGLSREVLSQGVRKIIETGKPTTVCGGVMAPGQIPRVTDFRNTSVKEFDFLDESLKTPDPILDDQALFFLAPKSVLIALRRRHAGLVYTIRTIESRINQ